MDNYHSGQTKDILLFANGDISLKSSLKGFFLLIVSYGLEMGSVLLDGKETHCLFTQDGSLLGMEKESAVCSIDVSHFEGISNRLTGSKHVPFFNKRGGVNNFTVHTTEFLRTVNILFDQNKDSRIVMDKKEGTGWRGCRKRDSGESDGVKKNSNSGGGLEYHGWRYSTCPPHSFACAQEVATLTIEIVNCKHLWKLKDFSTIGYSINAYSTSTTPRPATKNYTYRLETSRLVAALSSGQFDDKTIKILADIGESKSLKCSIKSSLLRYSPVHETDSINFYFVTPMGLRITQTEQNLVKFQIKGNKNRGLDCRQT
ncbi:uncharacterized protein LOC142343111 [Convolutriloba macropyga]|uniref:uncharacterized protein LOC142343111 n=1 Tax=Convolutriloba macropyga TaxID=536237 RepID=UPI003F51C21F